MPSDLGIALLGVVGTALGAVVGGLVVLFAQRAAEKDRQGREARAFRRELRTDLIRWAAACESAADFELSVDLSRNLTWRDVAARSTLHLPDGLALAAFHLYYRRERTEAAYRELAAGIAGIRRLFAVRYELRRWMAMASVFLRWMDRGDQTPLLEGPLTLVDETAVFDALVAQTADELRQTFGYEVGNDLELLPGNFSEAALSRLASEYEDARRSAAEQQHPGVGEREGGNDR